MSSELPTPVPLHRVDGRVKPGHDDIAPTKIESAILALAAGRTSVTPEDVARSLAPEAWRPLLGPVRRHAAALAAAGRIDILRKGKPIDPAEMRGVIRLRLRAEGA